MMVILNSFIWNIYQLWITIFFFTLNKASYLILIVDIIKLCISSGNGSINAKEKRFYYRLNSIQFKRYDTLPEMECRS